MNHFNLFNLPVTYSLDSKALDRQYFALQVKYHPDRAKNEEEKVLFMKSSTLINEAYKVLKHEFSRASYMLKLQNMEIEQEGVNRLLPPEILERVWDAREELEEARDTSLFPEGKIEERKELLVDLSNAFDIANYEKAAILTLMLKYLDNLIVSAKEKLA